MTNHHQHIKYLFTACLLGCIFLLACENDVNDVKALGNGRIGAKLTAPLLLRYQGDSARKTEFPNSLFVEFYDDSMKVESRLSAKYGRYLQNESKVYLRDQVVIYNVKGDTLYCDELYWDQNLAQFYTATPVTLIQNYPYKQKGRYANGFRSNQDLTDITFFNIQPGSFAIVPDSTFNQ
jgi:LPS export ABC transporter protein LptC